MFRQSDFRLIFDPREKPLRLIRIGGIQGYSDHGTGTLHHGSGTC